jgi:hypothetical protein
MKSDATRRVLGLLPHLSFNQPVEAADQVDQRGERLTAVR